MDNNIDKIITPVGRMIQGDPWNPQERGFNGTELRTRTGKPKIVYYVGLAISKTEPKIKEVLDYLQNVARRAFPNGEYQRESFAWKYKDGDKGDNKDKPGFAGNYVFRLTTGFPIDVVKRGANNQLIYLTDKDAKRGDYFKAAISAVGNGQSGVNCGLFLNISALEWIAYGEAIANRPNPQELFNTPYTGPLPPGASLTPIDNGPTVISEEDNNIPIPPAPDYLQPKIKEMTEKANGLSYEKWIEKGWTDDLLIDNGYMKAS